MKLIELEPRWIHPNVFTFLCPHCRKWRLSCRNIKMSHNEEWDLFEKFYGAEHNVMIVGCKPKCAWAFESGADFSTLSVRPSIDASASGHWHGFITNGEVT